MPIRTTRGTDRVPGGELAGLEQHKRVPGALLGQGLKEPMTMVGIHHWAGDRTEAPDAKWSSYYDVGKNQPNE